MERSLEHQASIKKTLAGALAGLPAVEDPEQLDRLASMDDLELRGVLRIFEHGLAETVEEALTELYERLRAGKEAARRRAKFSVLEGGRECGQ